jgi:hypothetical protein
MVETVIVVLTFGTLVGSPAGAGTATVGATFAPASAASVVQGGF